MTCNYCGAEHSFDMICDANWVAHARLIAAPQVGENTSSGSPGPAVAAPIIDSDTWKVRADAIARELTAERKRADELERNLAQSYKREAIHHECSVKWQERAECAERQLAEEFARAEQAEAALAEANAALTRLLAEHQRVIERLAAAQRDAERMRKKTHNQRRELRRLNKMGII